MRTEAYDMSKFVDDRDGAGVSSLRDPLLEHYQQRSLWNESTLTRSVMSRNPSTDVGVVPVNSPFRWAGGKSRIRRKIISLFPPHVTYVEPFAGAAWVLLGKVPSLVEVLGDKETEITVFFRVIKEQPEAFLDSFKWELCSRAEFDRQVSLDVRLLSDVERAHRFYYIIMAGWGGELRYPRFQTSVSDGGHGNRLIGALSSLPQRIWPVHRRLQSVTIEDMDWAECLARYDSSTSLTYLDPPYPMNKVNYSQNMRDWELHAAIARRLERSRGMWVLSSYDHPRVRDLFEKYTIIPTQFYSGLKAEKDGSARVVNREVLIMNFAPLSFPD
jgi:DNA adenine methylase